MELSKQLIHMEREYPSVSTQFVLEEDLIIPDSKPDISKILLHRHDLFISETRTQEQKVHVSGSLHFSILYCPEGNEARLNSIHGEIPFEEQIQMDQVNPSDTIQITADVEDFNLRIINSRKCNLHTLIHLTAVKSELYDIELPVPEEDEKDSSFICQTKKVDFLELCTLKKDICRIREEQRLPDNFPCIENLLYSNVTLTDMEIIPGNEKLALTCMLHGFFLYVGEGEDHPIRYLESNIPFSTSLECSTSQPGMIPNISYRLSHSTVDIRCDNDGEPRAFSIEQVLDLNIRLYQENSITILDDIYHCHKECNLVRKEDSFQTLCEHNSCRQSIQGKCNIHSLGNVLQLIYPSCHLQSSEPKVTDDGIEIEGAFVVQSLYLCSNDNQPYDCFTTTIPFHHKIEIAGICEDATSSVTISLDKVSISSLSGEEAEITASVNYEILVTCPQKENIITELSCSEFDYEKIGNLPGYIIYYVQPGDTLWKLAKRYYVSVSSIMEDNDLSSDLLMPGQKLLIVR